MTCSQIDVKFKDLSYVVRIGYRGAKKQILKGLSGIFRYTELTAIIGASGAGKTTLLNILSGFQNSSYTGTVEYLNRNDKQNRRSYKKQRCYIQQTNYLHEFFTIHEIMMIASYLKINWSFSRESRQILIDDILNTLKLSHLKKTRVEHLSGGEKKRLSIALELIDKPSLMFLDEPTTGLDSSSSTQCVTILKTLAQTGRTIICTIHQPSALIYEMFDHIYLVADGHCMYRSTPGDTVDYFARQDLQCPKYHNPAEYIMDVVSKEYGDYDEQLIAAAKCFGEPNDEARLSESSRDIIQEVLDNNVSITLTNSPTEIMQFWMLLRRCVILAHRDRSTVYFKLILHFFVAIFVGLFHMNVGNEGNPRAIKSNFGYLAITIIHLVFTSIFPALLKLSLEINILRKECFNNWYKLRTYYLAAFVCTLPLQIVFASVYTLITYFMTNQPLEFFRLFMFLLINILTNLIFEAIGLVLGTIPNILWGFIIACGSVCVMFNFAGGLIWFKHMSRFMYYLTYLDVLRYILDGLFQSIYGYQREKLSCSISYCYYQIPNVILDQFGFVKPMFWLNVVILFSHFVIFRILAYALLKKRL